MPWYAQFGCGGGGCDRIRYMKVVLQRVSQASVDVVNELGDLDPTFDLQQIGPGFLLLVGVTDEDGDDEIAWLAHKILRLRVFEDEQGKMNRSIQDIGGEILSVSQFTLFADVRKGNRPSFVDAGKPEHADIMWIKFNEALRSGGRCSTRGAFRRPYARRPGQRRPGHDRHRHRRPPLIGRAAAAPSPCEGTVPRDGARDATRATRAEYCRVRVGSRICENPPDRLPVVTGQSIGRALRGGQSAPKCLDPIRLPRVSCRFRAPCRRSRRRVRRGSRWPSRGCRRTDPRRRPRHP